MSNLTSHHKTDENFTLFIYYNLTLFLVFWDFQHNPPYVKDEYFECEFRYLSMVVSNSKNLTFSKAQNELYPSKVSFYMIKEYGSLFYA